MKVKSLLILVIFVSISLTATAQTVDIPDPILRAAIAEALGKAPDDPILTGEMATLTRLTAGAWKISVGDVTGLEEATNLRSLRIYNTSTLDLSPLANLTNLTILHVERSIADPSPLANLTNLRTLDLEGSISNLSHLASLTNLTTLTLSQSISDLSPLANLTNLRGLKIYNTPSISDLSPLANLTNLQLLSLSSSPISDISPLADLTNLTRLHVDFPHNSSTSDLSALANLTNLRELRVGFPRNPSTSDLSPLANLTNLTRLTLWHGSISDISPLANLTDLTELHVDLPSNSTSDLSPLANLTNLTHLGFSSGSSFSSGSISDLSPLANLTNLTELEFRWIRLSYPAIHTHLPALESKGVSVSYDDRTPVALHKISGDETASDNSLLIVEVKGGGNLPFEGVPVTFAIVSGGGALGVTSTTTDAQGRAQSELTLGSDGEPNRVTASVVPFGLEALFTIGKSAVDIPDLTLRAAIAEALGKALNDTFLANEMATLTELAAGEDRISDLTGLERATNLTTLTLSPSSTLDLSPLADLTNLTTLTLNGWIPDISPLADLTNLTTLTLDGRILDLSPLADLTNLTTLTLDGRIPDLSPLADLTNLTTLTLVSFRSIPDISPLANLTNLTTLRIIGTSTSDISPLANLTNLTQLTLFLRGRSRSDVSPLADLTNLTALSIYNAPISHLSRLAGLSRLKEVTLSYCLISDISPLVENTGLGQDSIVYVRGNPLSYVSLHTHIPELQSRGVTVYFDDEAFRALLKVSGDYQNGAVSTSLPQPLVIEAHDENGFAVAGLQVEFTVSQGDGALGAAIATTDENGSAQTTLTLGPNPGTNSVHVSAPGFYDAVFHAIADSEMPPVSSDVNDDGTTNILDLVLVSSALGSAGDNLAADVNGDGVVDILDLVLVAGMLGDAAAPPSARLQALETFTEAEVKQWLNDIRLLRLENPIAQRGKMMLERLLASLIPEETELLANYPNPFNPETWIPYQLAEDSAVSVSIYDTTGKLVRTLPLGIQSAGFYDGREHAAYWDGRNNFGERVASGIYFYRLMTPNFHQTRRLVIVK